ncbi:hypothetical protein BCR32DRAFT_291994 [Anaeromyces robustus]|uniref:Uncharacterized protein n=1 Tax=Anaeromyces robustus TaxID=1754192 RepID=A0A1Y1XCH4_9FUNG|nr:hypothetical protein BCR32DRAFT_291994 [Anaeromyces robustus]|eukprot:ORX83417.1 hypothetical protein BCR32DRAFT_291994 [Anaeromyces robustus]
MDNNYDLYQQIYSSIFHNYNGHSSVTNKSYQKNLKNIYDILIYKSDNFVDSQETFIINIYKEKEDILNLWKLETIQILKKSPILLEKVFHQQCLDIIMISLKEDCNEIILWILELIYFILLCLNENYYNESNNVEIDDKKHENKFKNNSDNENSEKNKIIKEKSNISENENNNKSGTEKSIFNQMNSIHVILCQRLKNEMKPHYVNIDKYFYNIIYQNFNIQLIQSIECTIYISYVNQNYDSYFYKKLENYLELNCKLKITVEKNTDLKRICLNLLNTSYLLNIINMIWHVNIHQLNQNENQIKILYSKNKSLFLLLKILNVYPLFYEININNFTKTLNDYFKEKKESDISLLQNNLNFTIENIFEMINGCNKNINNKDLSKFGLNEFLEKEKITIYKLILLLFDNENKQLLYWELKYYSYQIIQWLWDIEKPTSIPSTSSNNINHFNELKLNKKEISNISKLRVQITMKWLTIYYEETSELYFTSIINYIIKHNIHNKILDHIDFQSGNNNLLIIVIIIIMAWNIQKDKNMIYENWRPYIKYIWLIIYKFIINKIESSCWLYYITRFIYEYRNDPEIQDIMINYSFDSILLNFKKQLNKLHKSHIFNLTISSSELDLNNYIKILLDDDDKLLKNIHNTFIKLENDFLSLKTDLNQYSNSDDSDSLFSSSPDFKNYNPFNGNQIDSSLYYLNEKNYPLEEYSFSTFDYSYEQNHEIVTSNYDNNPEELLIFPNNYNIIYKISNKKPINTQFMENNDTVQLLNEVLKTEKDNLSFNKNDNYLYVSIMNQYISCYCSSSTLFTSIMMILNKNLNIYYPSFNSEDKNNNSQKISTNSSINESKNKNDLNIIKNNNEKQSIKKNITNLINQNLFLSPFLNPNSNTSPPETLSSIQSNPNCMNTPLSSNILCQNSILSQSSLSYSSQLYEIVFKYIPYLFNLFSLKELIQNLFPRSNNNSLNHHFNKVKTKNTKKKTSNDSSNYNKYYMNNNHNFLFHIMILNKKNNFVNTYKTSSHIQLLYQFLKMHFQYNEFFQIIKKEEQNNNNKNNNNNNNEINNSIKTPSKMENIILFPHKYSIISSKIHSQNSPNSNINKDDNLLNNFMTWFIFCNLYCREILLNYFITDLTKNNQAILIDPIINFLNLLNEKSCPHLTIRYNNDYWNKIIIEYILYQIKDILLEWTSNLTSSQFLSFNSSYFTLNSQEYEKDPCSHDSFFSNNNNNSNDNDDNDNDNNNNSNNNTESLYTILQISPFLSLYCLIKDFLMKEIFKINIDDTNKDKNYKDINDSNSRIIHPILLLYTKVYSSYTLSFEKIKGLLAYLKIINYFLTIHPFIVINQIYKKIIIDLSKIPNINILNSDSIITLNVSQLDLLLLLYLCLKEINETVAKKINKKKRNKTKIKEWKEDEIEIIINSNKTFNNLCYKIIINKKKLKLLCDIELLVNTILIKIKSVQYLEKKTMLINTNNNENYNKKNSKKNNNEKNKTPSTLSPGNNSNPTNIINNNEKKIFNNINSQIPLQNINKFTQLPNNNYYNNYGLRSEKKTSSNTSNNNYSKKKKYDKETHLKLKLKLLWIDLKKQDYNN